MSKAWANGSDYNWRARVRPAVLQQNVLENQGRCRLAIEGTCKGTATEVHHTLGRAITGDDPRYLIAVCKACNLKVGDPTKYKEAPSTLLSHWT